MSDMTIDIFAQHPFGKAALKKMGTVPENFRLYCAGWIGAKPEDWKCMDVTGAEFRSPTRGPNKGKLTIKIPGTQRKVRVTRAEMQEFA